MKKIQEKVSATVFCVRDKSKLHMMLKARVKGGRRMPERQRNDITLTEADEKAFIGQLKQGIYKELYRRDCLTLSQLRQLQNIA